MPPRPRRRRCHGRAGAAWARSRSRGRTGTRYRRAAPPFCLAAMGVTSSRGLHSARPRGTTCVGNIINRPHQNQRMSGVFRENARLDNASTTSVNVASRLCSYCSIDSSSIVYVYAVCITRGRGSRRGAPAGGGRGGSSSPGATLAFHACTCCTKRSFLRYSNSDLAPLLPWSAKVAPPLSSPLARPRQRWRSQSRARRGPATG